MTNNVEQFYDMANKMADLGYKEVNLNFGCPSRTVVTKKKGSGFLAYPEELNCFLSEIFYYCRDMEISIKTRIGMWETSEAEKLFAIFEKFPFTEVIIHARLGSEFYGGTPHHDVFENYGSYSRHSLCYNGDVVTAKQLESLDKKWAFCDKFMLGRGLIARPGMLKKGMGIDDVTTENGDSAKNVQEGVFLNSQEIDRFRQFHDELLDGYAAYLSGDRNLLFRMKELWSYWIRQFPNEEKIFKKIKKSNSLEEYRIAVNHLIDEHTSFA